ncbi:hypothetical protein PJE062_4179 [Pseudovibrio sp. JE062]|nr:hypothetical protein PJE062_4179 [Pseudovibrio sp. JE062]
MTNFVETVSYPEQKRRRTAPMHILMMKGRFERSRAFHTFWQGILKRFSWTLI